MFKALPGSETMLSTVSRNDGMAGGSISPSEPAGGRSSFASSIGASANALARISGMFEGLPKLGGKGVSDPEFV